MLGKPIDTLAGPGDPLLHIRNPALQPIARLLQLVRQRGEIAAELVDQLLQQHRLHLVRLAQEAFCRQVVMLRLGDFAQQRSSIAQL